MAEVKLKTPLNNAQLEILNLFSRDLNDKDLIEIKRLLVKFLAQKATTLANQVWEDKGWTNEEMDKLAHTHLRTPYKKG